MSCFLWEMGLSKEWGIVDVLGFDEELLHFLPQPVVALILLYPTSKVQCPGDGEEPAPEGVYFMKQTVRNACGTIALLHAVGNNLDTVPLTPESTLQRFYSKTLALTPEERGSELENSRDISQTHETCAQEGQTAAPEVGADIDFHFIAFVRKSGRLYELNGNKKGPVNHGTTGEESFVRDAAAVCRDIMSQNPECLNFTAVALAKLASPPTDS